MRKLSATRDGPRIVFAFGGHWAICPKCLWDSGEALPRGKAYEAGMEHDRPCTDTTPSHYSTERVRENQVMLSGQS